MREVTAPVYRNVDRPITIGDHATTVKDGVAGRVVGVQAWMNEWNTEVSEWRVFILWPNHTTEHVNAEGLLWVEPVVSVTLNLTQDRAHALRYTPVAELEDSEALDLWVRVAGAVREQTNE